MKISAIAVVLAASAASLSVAHADSVEDVVIAQIQPSLPTGTDVAKVYLPAKLAKLEVDPADVIVELPRELHVGRKSVKVTVRGAKTVFVPVAIAQMVSVAIAARTLAVGDTVAAGDVRIMTRAIESASGQMAQGQAVIGARIVKAVAAGKPIGAKDIALPPPLPRGTQVTVELRRGQVRVTGQGTLELVARPGEQATVRLAQNGVTLRGTLVAPSTVVVGGNL